MQHRLLIIAVAVLLGGIGLRAQNNPYKIDDSCYECMSKADALIGKEGFDEATTKPWSCIILKDFAIVAHFAR